jgi:hypothetical protein
VTYCDQLHAVFSKEAVGTIYVCISGAMLDKDTECVAEFEEVFGVVWIERELVEGKVQVRNVLVCIRVGLVSWWRGDALLSVQNPLNDL